MLTYGLVAFSQVVRSISTVGTALKRRSYITMSIVLSVEGMITDLLVCFISIYDIVH